VAITPDLNRTHPYTPKTLGKSLGKNQNWASVAAGALGILHRPEYCYAINGASGQVMQRRFTENARRLLEQQLQAEPTWNPRREPAPVPLRSTGAPTGTRAQ
jgi:hypothetical protein